MELVPLHPKDEVIMVSTVKPQLQTLLRHGGLYYRLKASFWYRLYWAVFDAGVLRERNREFAFYRNTLPGFRKGDLVFDIGANQGSKTETFLRMGARVLAVDPDTANRDILRERFHKLRMSRKPVMIVNKAVSDKITTMTMWVEKPGSAKNTLSRKWVDALSIDAKRFGQALTFGAEMLVETTTLDELINEYGVPFFIKIDVEGHEVSVLEGLSRPVRHLSFEVNLPEFRTEGLRCVEILRQLSRNGMFNYVVDCSEDLVLRQWLTAERFSAVLNECSESSIEVFWRNNPI